MIVGFLLILMTALPILRYEVWWIRVFDFPRIQIFVVGVVLLSVFLLFVGVSGIVGAAFVILLFASLSYQAYMMYPYMRFAPCQTEWSQHDDHDSTISLLFANVLMTNDRFSDLRRVIRDADADLVLLVETDERWMNGIKEAVEEYPYSIERPLDNTYGMLLYSRLRLIDSHVRYLVQDDIPSIRGQIELRSGARIEFRCLHPRPPFPTEHKSAEPRDAEIIIVGKENRKNNAPFIVFGDLNDVAWSRTNYLFQNISGLLDPRVGRGFYNTFHAKIPFVKFPLDHLFHSNHFRLIDFRRLKPFGSDHYPVYAKLSLEPDARLTQEEPEPEVEEEIEAAEKAEYAKNAGMAEAS